MRSALNRIGRPSESMPSRIASASTAASMRAPSVMAPLMPLEQWEWKARTSRPSFVAGILSRAALAEVQFGERAEIDAAVLQEPVPLVRHTLRVERVAAPGQPRVPAE